MTLVSRSAGERCDVDHNADSDTVGFHLVRTPALYACLYLRCEILRVCCQRAKVMTEQMSGRNQVANLGVLDSTAVVKTAD